MQLAPGAVIVISGSVRRSPASPAAAGQTVRSRPGPFWIISRVTTAGTEADGEKERLTALGGLAALSLDALSSVAYGPEAILVVLVAAGTAGLKYSLYITGAIVVADIVVRKPRVFETMVDEILESCRRALPPHKVPAMLREVASLDISESGKLTRNRA